MELAHLITLQNTVDRINREICVSQRFQDMTRHVLDVQDRINGFAKLAQTQSNAFEITNRILATSAAGVAQGIQAQMGQSFLDFSLRLQQTMAIPSEIVRAIQATNEGVLSEINRLNEWADTNTLRTIGTSAEDMGLTKLHGYLLERSWALPIDAPLSFIFLLSDMLELNEAEDIENEMRKYFSENIDDIEETLLSEFPNRARVLNDAFRAHRRGEFTLSVPVMLIQIDGIWHDLARENFYRSRGKKMVEGLLVRESGGAKEIIILTLTDLGTIRRSTTEIANIPDALSRHAVLHGLSLDYPTDYNGLKCISWLSLLASISQFRRRNECGDCER